MVKLITKKDLQLAAITLVIGASMAIGYDIIQDFIRSIIHESELYVKVQAGGISIAFGVVTLACWINALNKKENRTE